MCIINLFSLTMHETISQPCGIYIKFWEWIQNGNKYASCYSLGITGSCYLDLNRSNFSKRKSQKSKFFVHESQQIWTVEIRIIGLGYNFLRITADLFPSKTR